MKLLTFKYSKEDKITDRVFVPLHAPSDLFFGIDISELDMEDQAYFSIEVEKILLDKKEQIANLMAELDIKHSYRYFRPEQMLEVKEHEL
jgi:hypothetical protein